MATKNMLCPRCWGSKKEYVELTCSKCVLCKGTGAVPDVRLSPHFWLSEFLVSQTAIRNQFSNEPTEEHVENLKKLCIDLLEPLRKFTGPVSINSGYRAPALNGALPGASRTSAHQLANAADMRFMRTSLKDAMNWLITSKLPYDQAIYEGTWLHVGRLSPAGKVRGQNLMMFPDRDGKPRYYPYNPNDPRVVL